MNAVTHDSAVSRRRSIDFFIREVKRLQREIEIRGPVEPYESELRFYIEALGRFAPHQEVEGQENPHVRLEDEAEIRDWETIKREIREYQEYWEWLQRGPGPRNFRGPNQCRPPYRGYDRSPSRK
jgi:hypothetical protein